MAQGKGSNITSWILGGLLAAVFVMAGLPKLGLGGGAMIEEVATNFERWGHSAGFRAFVGAAEIAGAIGLLIPRLASLAACGLILVMAGAVYTHVSHGEPFAPPLVILVLLGVVAWLRRPAGAAEAAQAGGATAVRGADDRAA